MPAPTRAWLSLAWLPSPSDLSTTQQPIKLSAVNFQLIETGGVFNPWFIAFRSKSDKLTTYKSDNQTVVALIKKVVYFQWTEHK
jgi:hypothetical protein